MENKKERLLVIDANSLIHRSWHALPPLSTQKGEAVQAVYGFLSILFKAIKEFDPTHIAAAFDVEGPTFRHEQFEAYKATRQKAPDELYGQIPLVKEALRALHVSVFEKKGFEADDIIGTIANKAAQEKNVEITIVSGDLDTLQLVGERTKVYTMRKGVQDTVLYGAKEVQKRFEGLEPGQLRDYKGLRGDPSDNIPGVSGVGEKTATQLINKFGSLEALYAALEKNEVESVKPSLREKLLSQKERAFGSKELATINTQVPIQFQEGRVRWEKPSAKEVRELLARFEFQSLLSRMPQSLQSRVLGERESEEKSRQEEKMGKIERLYKEQVFSKKVYDLERRLVPVLRKMERIGIRVDLPHFQKLTKDMERETAGLQKRICEHAGQKFNINSTQQLSRVLFEAPPGGLGLSSQALKKTPKRVVSTASTELEKLADAHPMVNLVLRYREIRKLVTTYAKPLPRLADEKSRIHTHFDQLGAATGRISSSEPNLQNIPNQGEWGKRIRRGFVAEQGFELVSFDYSQMELRIAASVAGDVQMRRFFEQGADIHRMTASAVFGVPEHDVSSEMRFRAKALNFGVLYGMGPQGFAKSAGISFQEAQEFIDSYFARFPGIYEYMEQVKNRARSQGYAETLWGRRRYLPEINSRTPQLRSAAERMAINHPIQGTLADLVKMVMVRVEEELRFPDEQVRMLLQIHDELLFEITHGMLKEAGRQIQGLMEAVWDFDIPVRVDVKRGQNWADVEKIS